MTAIVPSSGLMMMAGDRLGGRLVQPLYVVNESHVALDELASSGDVVRSKRLLCHEVVESSVEPISNGFGQQPCHLIERASLNRFVGGRDRRPEIAAGRLEPGIGGTFTSPMDANQRLEEVAVCQFLR